MLALAARLRCTRPSNSPGVHVALHTGNTFFLLDTWQGGGEWNEGMKHVSSGTWQEVAANVEGNIWLVCLGE